MEGLHKSRKWWILAGLGLSALIVNLDFTIVYTAIPTLQKSLSASLSELQWLMGGFGVSFATLLTVSGRLGDIFGRRLVLYIGMVGFLLSSVGAGLSSHAFELIVFRFLQGLFGAPLFPCGFAIIGDTFSKEKRGQASGIFTGIAGVGLALGPVVGGAIVSYLSWRWIFFINIPFILLSFLILFPLLKESKKSQKEKLDVVGMVLIIVGFFALIFALTEGQNWGWSHPIILGPLLLGILLLILFAFWEERVASPICPLHLFKNRGFLIGTFCFMCGVAPAWALLFVLPLYLQNVLHYEAGQVGMILLSLTLMTLILPPLTGIFLDKKGAKATVFTLFFILFVGLILMRFFSEDSSLALILAAFIFYGAGWGMANAAAFPITMRHLPDSENAGIVSGASITLLNVMGVFLLTILGTLFRWKEKLCIDRTLHKEGIFLNSTQEHLIRSSLSDSENAKKILEPLGSEISAKVLSLFKSCFVSGFHLVLTILIFYIIISFLIIWRPLLKEKK